MSDLPIDSLRPNPWNTNVVSPENELKIEASLKRFGFFKPVICRELADGSLQILGGEHRWRVAKKLGYKVVPVINLGAIDDKKAQEIGLVDNGRYGEDDTLQLAELLKGLGSPDELAAFLPHTEADFAAIFSSSTISTEDLDLPAETDLPDLSAAKAPQTHQLMRFKVPVPDAPRVTEIIEGIMKRQGFKEEDSYANAGNALVWLIQNYQPKE